MATPQLSPGVIVREVDLTVGRADNVLDNIGAIAAPFTQGPVDEPIDITTQGQLLQVFGEPQSNDRHYEYWLTASEYLTYGGVLKVVRTDGSNLNNANAGVGVGSTSPLKINSYDDYNLNYSTATNFNFAARNPGTWADGLKVCFIDNAADQTIGITTTNLAESNILIGYGVTAVLSSAVIPGAGTTSTFNGYLKGIITGVTTDTTNGNSSIDVRIVSRVSSAGTETNLDYQQNDPARSIEAADTIEIYNNAGIQTGKEAVAETFTVGTAVDWYDEQTLGLTNSTIYWKTIAPKPLTTNYVAQRSGRNDALHVAVVDDEGKVTGIQGNILERQTFLSKALDGETDGDAPTKSWYKDFISLNSQYVFAGRNLSSGNDSYHNTVPTASGFSSGFTKVTDGGGLWGQDAQGTQYAVIGNATYSLLGGADYSANGGMSADLGDLSTSYNLFSNKDEISVDYLIMGPGLGSVVETQAKANLLISIADARKDCIATISPDRTNIVGQSNTATQTNSLVTFYSPVTSSSYAVFDSGYKYMYDRFNNTFRYIPLNGDIAGLMVRTSIESFPWFSPAGQQRGTINNAVKLAYNPNKAQRDTLYGNRINSVINQSGQGIVLFGDKTGLSYSSAFDRINVRRLFLTVEQALESAANDQLFELNDDETRSNFINIVEPYLRDVQSQRGIEEFVIICDGTNNTPDIIDNNEFRADIFIKPTRAINYVTLTFVATRTGVSFDEVVGSL
tara:strand:- start:9793 stop:11994 length:2202 start_codon:yes stop_codon:yes gene_type:complete